MSGGSRALFQRRGKRETWRRGEDFIGNLGNYSRRVHVRRLKIAREGRKEMREGSREKKQAVWGWNGKKFGKSRLTSSNKRNWMTRANDGRRKSEEKHKGHRAKREKQGGMGEGRGRTDHPSWIKLAAGRMLVKPWNYHFETRAQLQRAIFSRDLTSDRVRKPVYRLTYSFPLSPSPPRTSGYFNPRDYPGIIKFLPFQKPRSTFSTTNHLAFRFRERLTRVFWKWIAKRIAKLKGSSDGKRLTLMVGGEYCRVFFLEKYFFSFFDSDCCR